MPYDIRCTRPVEPDEIRFVAVRDGARERCITCRGSWPRTSRASRCRRSG